MPHAAQSAEDTDSAAYTDIASTGMKCLPAKKVSQCKGAGIHDWHAEVLVLRAFNRFVLQECRDVLLHGDESLFLQFRQKSNGKDKSVAEFGEVWDGQPFEWREEVILHMYCSEAPCKIRDQVEQSKKFETQSRPS